MAITISIKGLKRLLETMPADQNIMLSGRGGTDFQPVIDFAHSKRGYYHGLIIFTDGFSTTPRLPDFYNTPTLWVLPSEQEYETHKGWMCKIGKACFIE